MCSNWLLLIWSPTHSVPGHLVPHNWSPRTNSPGSFGPHGQMVPKTIGPPGQLVPKHLVPMDKWSPRKLVPLDKQSPNIWSPWTNGPQDNWSPRTIGPQNLLVVSKSIMEPFFQFFEIGWSTLDIMDDFKPISKKNLFTFRQIITFCFCSKTLFSLLF